MLRTFPGFPVVERRGKERHLPAAAPPIRADITERLGLRDPAEVAGSFDRPNLRLEALRFQEHADKRRAVLERVAAEPKPGLVYVATRKYCSSRALFRTLVDTLGSC